MKVGKISKRTGISVRTLHYYDEIGLLSPSIRSEAGHRIYSEADLARLLQIKSLQHLGFSLEQVRGCLDDPQFSPTRVIAMHVARLEEQIAVHARLCDRLRAIAARLEKSQSASGEEFIQALEEINMIEKYYTPEQLEYLRQRRETVGQERMEQAQAEWGEIFERYRALAEKSADPSGDEARELALKSASLIREFSGGDAGIEQSLANMYRAEGGPQVLGSHGVQVDQQVWDFMGQAMNALKKPE